MKEVERGRARGWTDRRPGEPGRRQEAARLGMSGEASYVQESSRGPAVHRQGEQSPLNQEEGVPASGMEQAHVSAAGIRRERGGEGLPSESRSPERSPGRTSAKPQPARASSQRRRPPALLPVTLLLFLFFGLLAGTLLSSEPPVTGRAELQPQTGEERSWQAAYSPGTSVTGEQPPVSGELRQLQASLPPDLLFLAGPARLAGGGTAPRTFFPIADGSGGTPDSGKTGPAFPHIPEEQLPGYGRTAYFVDYGGARFWFLNAAKLAQEPQLQLAWLQRTAAENRQLHGIVLLAEEPAAPEAWQAFTAAGAELVLAGGRLWASAAAVQTPPPEGYRAAPSRPGWAEGAPPR
ncbi:hypothetical protein ACKTOS_28330, partial [Paenibacillus sp. KR2-11]